MMLSKWRSITHCLLISCLMLGSNATYANDCSDEGVKDTAERFVEQFYKDLKEGEKSKIRQYFLPRPDKETLELLDSTGRIISQKLLDDEDLEWMIGSGKFLDEMLAKIEFLEMTVIVKKPLIIELLVRESYKSEDSRKPPLEELFILKNIGGCKWKIVDITQPGLP